MPELYHRKPVDAKGLRQETADELGWILLKFEGFPVAAATFF